MVYQVLARKWRPKTFSEVIGQDHIAKTLQNSILKEKIAHAYLFTGTRGVGKTTIARIFAKAIRCENKDEKANPCLECVSCKAIDQANSLDYVEIDGASNNSVDNVRELIENAQYLPSSGKFKVYVVDEVHMLSTSAFNALLKTLEEPPEHVVFIFATTDPHKLLGTVLSRCQRFDFKHVSMEELASHIKNIAEKEEIEFDSDHCVQILARQGNGSVRDTLSLMDQALSLSSGEVITEEVVLRSLGLARADSIKSLAQAMLSKNAPEALAIFDETARENVELEKFSNQLLDKIFTIIENVDDHEGLKSQLDDPDLAQSMDTAELLWVYEALLKDFEWGLQAFDSLRAIRFSILKICKRDEIVGRAPAQVKKKPKNELAPASNAISNRTEAKVPAQEAPEEKLKAPAEELKAPEEKLKAPEKEKTGASESEALEAKTSNTETLKPEAPKFEKNWDGFLGFIKTTNQGISMNLERAKLLSDPQASRLVLGFTEEEKIFHDFLNEAETFKKLNELARDFFESPEAGVRLETLDSETKERDKLYSSVEMEEKKISAIKEEKEKRLRENRFIKEAQELFNGKISKIHLNEDE